MRRFAVIVLCAIAVLFAAIDPGIAQTPAPPVPTPAPPAVTPTPNPIDACFEKGVVACLPPIARQYGVWGAVVLMAVSLSAYVVYKLFDKMIDTGIGRGVSRWASRPAPLSPVQIERREAEYLQEQYDRLKPVIYLNAAIDVSSMAEGAVVKGFEIGQITAASQSRALQSPDAASARLEAYLTEYRDHEDPLKPSEETVYVPLEGGLDITPRIGWFRGGQPNERLSLLSRLRRAFTQSQPVEASRLFTEQKSFDNIEDAINAVDESTQAPYPVLALLGEPGAGKSTLLRKFARDRIQQRIEDPAALLPVYVSLSAHTSGSPKVFLRREWIRMLGFDGLDDALAAGRIWLFADGLNEMPRAGYDSRMAEWRAFLREHFLPHGNRAVVTCRVIDYGEGIGAPRLVIHKMNEDQIHDFLQKRIPDRADVLWRELKNDRDESNGKIYELAQIPFWLVRLTRLSGRTGLPRNRAGLLDESIKDWLDHENSRSGGRVLTDLQRRAFMDGLTDLAWEGLRRSQNYTFRSGEAQKILCNEQKVVSADDLLVLGRDCSLLAVEGEIVRFQHQLLQEFFAARELARRFLEGKNLRSTWRTPWRRWKFVRSRWDPLPDPPQTGWEEAVILAAGMLDASQAERLANAVLKDTPALAERCIMESGVQMGPDMQCKTQERLLQDLHSTRLRLPARLAAGKALARIGDPRLLDRLHECPSEDGKTIRFIEPEWVEIPGGVFTMGTTPQEIRSMRIFHRLQPSSDELPAHPVFTGAFQMARYPVTVAEYRCFMDAGGYENDAYWQEAHALRWRNAPLPFEESYAAYQIKLLRENEKFFLEQLDRWVKQGSWSPAQANATRQQLKMQDDEIRKQWDGYEAQKRDAEGRAIRPWGWENSDLAVANRPVVGVTWYEACAYAAWLTDLLHRQNRMDKTTRVRLPTEAEWEKAARGGRQALWAWGNRWSPKHANTLEGRVMRPTPVGAYSPGASRDGVQDLNGNVWEWCSDWYAEDIYRTRAGQAVKDPQGPEQGNARVLRGGAWYDSRYAARCAYRLRLAPDDFVNRIGFRCVRSPFTSEL